MRHFINKNTILIVTLLILLDSCGFEEEKRNKFNDPNILQIQEQRFNHWRTHLLSTLDQSNPIYKTEAILAITSMREKIGYHKIADLLQHDTSTLVRATAAYFFGRMGGINSQKILLDANLREKNEAVKSQILLALSKSIAPTEIAAIFESEHQNKAIKLAQFKSLVNIKKRGISIPEMYDSAMAALRSPNEHKEIRFLAANLLSQGDSTWIAKYSNELSEILQKESDDLTRSNLLTGMGKLNDIHNAKIFIAHLSSKNDLVRIASLHGLKKLNILEKDSIFSMALNDSSKSVALAASEILRFHKNEFKKFDFLGRARMQKKWDIRLNLYEAHLLNTNDVKITDTLTKTYFASKNDFEKAGIVKIIGRDSRQFAFLKQELESTKVPSIRTNCAWAIVALDIENKLIDHQQKAELLEIYKRGLLSGDPALAIIFSEGLFTRPGRLTDTNFLREAFKVHEAKKDYKAMMAIRNVIAVVEKKSDVEVAPEIKTPDWVQIKSIGKNQRITIKTTKGNITIRLLVENAPVAVSNFLQLIRENYYDSTTIFNVISNSSFQSGCKRGDGYGRKEYYLPYEASASRYDQPTLNIARKGQNGFESTQWFIDLNPQMAPSDNVMTIGVVETDITLLRRIEIGDKIITIDEIQ